MSLTEQLALFNQPNAADVFLKYASLSRAVYRAYMRCAREDDKSPKKTFAEKEAQRIFNMVYEPENEEEASLTFTKTERDEIWNHGGYLWPEVQLKFFDVFPKDVVRKILIDYAEGPLCFVSRDAQKKIFTFFTKDEAKDLLLNSKIKLYGDAQMLVFEQFNKDDAIQILAHNADLEVPIVNKILERPDAKEYLLEFFNLNGQFSPALWENMDKDAAGPQMLVIEHFPEDDATELLLKILTTDENADSLSEPVMNKIMDTFSKANAKKLLLTNIEEHDPYIWPETVSRFVDVFSKEDAKELLLAYMKNDAEFKPELQKKIIATFSREDAKEILMKNILNGCHFEDEILIMIIDQFVLADAIELIMTYIAGEDDFSDEFILKMIETFPKDEAKKFLKTYGKSEGRYGEDVEKKILTTFSKEDAKELLLMNMNNQSYFSNEIFIDILYLLPAADAKELIMTYLKNGEKDFSYELIANIMEILPKEDAKEILRKYKKNGGILCKEAQRFLGHN